jgi:hypothetical protein
MSTFRPTTRRIYPRRYRLGRPQEIHATRDADRSNLRGLVVAALLCLTVFAGAFALGHDGRTATATREAGPWAFPAVSAGAAIPARLNGAPAISVEAPRPKARTNTRSQAGAGTGAVVTSPSVATQPLAEGSAPVTPAAPTPPPTVTHSEPTPPPTPAPAATPRSTPSAPAHAPASPEPGKSFESSG